MFKKDEYWLGLLIAILLPPLVFLVLYLPGQIFESIKEYNRFYKGSVLAMISISANLLPLRYYFVSLKYDKTGRGILLVTFLLIIAYFILGAEKVLDQ